MKQLQFVVGDCMAVVRLRACKVSKPQSKPKDVRGSNLPWFVCHPHGWPCPMEKAQPE